MLKLTKILMDGGDGATCIIESKGNAIEDIQKAINLYNKVNNINSSELIGNWEKKIASYDLRKFKNNNIAYYNGWIDGRTDLIFGDE